MIRKLATALFVVTALLAGSTVAASAATLQPDFRAEALAAGLTDAQAASLQQRVDAVLAEQPGGRQVSATKVKYDGLTVTVDPQYSAAASRSSKANKMLSCAYGHLCMVVRGVTFDYYTCGLWFVSNWTGTGPYNNNQTPGTVARFYGQGGNLLWTSTAPDSGTANWDPVWSLRPC